MRDSKPFTERLEKLEKNIPNTEWICEVCGSRNNNWVINFGYIATRKGDKYRHGVCPRCEQKRQEQEKIDKDRKERAERYEEVKRLISKSKIPPNIASVQMQNIERRPGTERAFKMVDTFTLTDRRWVYLVGDTATGKSYLMGALVNKLAQSLIPVVYVNEPLFFDRLVKTWGKGSKENEADLFEMFEHAQVVIWDEFAMVDYMDKTTPNFKHEKAYAIIEYLSEYNKRVIFTSNIDYEKLEYRIGKRMMSRLKRNNTVPVVMKNTPFF